MRNRRWHGKSWEMRNGAWGWGGGRRLPRAVCSRVNPARDKPAIEPMNARLFPF